MTCSHQEGLRCIRKGVCQLIEKCNDYVGGVKGCGEVCHLSIC